jgi:hypothetical protein
MSSEKKQDVLNRISMDNPKFTTWTISRVRPFTAWHGPYQAAFTKNPDSIWY